MWGPRGPMWAHGACQSLPGAQTQACVDLHRGKVCVRAAGAGRRAAGAGRREVREKSVATAAPPPHTYTENCYPALQEDKSFFYMALSVNAFGQHPFWNWPLNKGMKRSFFRWL